MALTYTQDPVHLVLGLWVARVCRHGEWSLMTTPPPHGRRCVQNPHGDELTYAWLSLPRSERMLVGVVSCDNVVFTPMECLPPPWAG